MRITRRTIFILFLMALFSVTFVSWAYQSHLFKMNIKTSSKLDNGVAAEVTQLSGSASGSGAYTIHNGRAQKLAGIPLYKIKLAQPSFSELAQIYVTPNNFDTINGNKKMSKSNWWVVVNLYYEVPDVTSNPDISLSDGTLLKRLPNASLYMNGTKGSGILMPSTMIPVESGYNKAPYNDTLYVIATYVNPGGNASPGQQDQLNDLQFFCNVRM